MMNLCMTFILFQDKNTLSKFEFFTIAAAKIAVTTIFAVSIAAASVAAWNEIALAYVY